MIDSVLVVVVRLSMEFCLLMGVLVLFRLKVLLKFVVMVVLVRLCRKVW